MIIGLAEKEVNKQAFLTDNECSEVATHLEYLAVKSVLTSAERGLVLGATHAIKEHLTRETRDVGVGTARGRFTVKELLTEAERVLLRSAGGMSLLERLRRDALLREDMLQLLKDFAEQSNEVR